MDVLVGSFVVYNSDGSIDCAQTRANLMRENDEYRYVPEEHFLDWVHQNFETTLGECHSYCFVYDATFKAYKDFFVSKGVPNAEVFVQKYSTHFIQFCGQRLKLPAKKAASYLKLLRPCYHWDTFDNLYDKNEFTSFEGFNVADEITDFDQPGHDKNPFPKHVSHLACFKFLAVLKEVIERAR
jgi:hypothetical protein